MYSDTNTTRSVADAVMKVMNEKLHPNQQKLDVHEPEKDELTADCQRTSVESGMKTKLQWVAVILNTKKILLISMVKKK
jgi:hypothetical protein